MKKPIKQSNQQKHNKLRKKAEKILQNRDEEIVSSRADAITMMHELQVHQIELEMQNNELMETKIKADQALKRYTHLYDFAPVSYLTLDQGGAILHLNIAAAKILGGERAKLMGRDFQSYINHQDLPKFYLLMNDLSRHIQCDSICYLSLKNNYYVRIEATLDEKSDCYHLILFDMTDHKMAEDKLKLFASAFTHAHESIIITDKDSKIIEVNKAFTTITGYTREEVIGKNPRIFNSGRQPPEFYKDMWNELTEKGNWIGEIWNRRKNGEFFAGILAISSVCDADGVLANYIGLFADITKIKEYQGRLEYLAYYDVLTKLPNRLLLVSNLIISMQQCLRQKRLLAVAFLDLDNFKSVNDQYGHDVGDMFLIKLAENIKKILRKGDILARIGGDEFILIFVDLDQVEDCIPLLDRLLQSVSKPIMLPEATISITASVGVTFYPLDNSVADILLRHADQAMYLAKQSGRGRYVLFDVELDTKINIQLQKIQEINTALENNELILYYQPMVDIISGKVIGVEALVRWQHPSLGLLLPSEFLPFLLNHNLSIKLGEWVISTALSQISTWCSIGLDIPISVNILPFHLQQDDFVTRLQSLLAAHPTVAPRYLQLEVLENTELKDIKNTSETMKKCHKLGVCFALDDFGTGYSSLTYIRYLPIDLLKIDQSFIRDMLIDPDAMTIVNAILKLASAFELDVIAEGVETSEQRLMLMKLGCKLVQGNNISPAIPAQDVEQWMHHWYARLG